MPRQLALLIHSIDHSLSPVSRLLEARDYSIHVSRTIDEAERVFSSFPTDQLKFILADMALCHGPIWDRFMIRLANNAAQIALICYDPGHSQPLYNLLGHTLPSVNDPTSPHTIKAPVMIGES